MLRSLIFILLLGSASTAFADPILLLLLRTLRDQAISASLEAGYNSVQRAPALSAPTFGYALPTAPVTRDGDEQHLRTVIDENLLHLIQPQRDAVLAGLRKMLDDPRYMQMRSQIIAEFTLKARAIGDAYRVLDRLSYSEKRELVQRAIEEIRRLPAAQRGQLRDVLQAGMLPVPRDISELLLAEISGVLSASSRDARRD
jgi:hypothetical protein